MSEAHGTGIEVAEFLTGADYGVWTLEDGPIRPYGQILAVDTDDS